MSGGIIGTGGHIDHGKTALVAALTGADTDRLPEEKDRGISIDLGFTRAELGGREFGVVDVPGHEGFIRNMLAGATGFDLLLLVVAADEGVMPQTREHVAIAQLLGIPRAVVALTKTDLVDDDWLELVADDTAGFLASTPFADAPRIPVSSRTGEGLDRLRDAIAATPIRSHDPDDLFRLPLDRSFTVRGTGTVVTGSVWTGRLRDDATIRILPGGRTARVRGLQVHGQAVERVEAGQRAAVALAGLERDELTRGDVLVDHPGWTAASVLTVRLEVLPDSEWSIEQRQRIRVHLGTAEVLGRARLLGTSRIEPGQSGWAQLRLESPLTARAGDAFVVRSYSPVTTIGGGRVLEPAARKRRAAGPELDRRLDAVLERNAAAAVHALLEEAGPRGVPVEPLPVHTGCAPAAVDAALEDPAVLTIAGRAFRDGLLTALQDRLASRVDSFHEAYPLRQGMDLEELRRAAPQATHPELVEEAIRRLVGAGSLAVRDGRIGRAGYRPRLDPDQEALRRQILDAVRKADSAPPSIDELRTALGRPADLEDIVRLLEADSVLVRLPPDGLIMETRALDELAARVASELAGRSSLGPADFRAVVPLSRKYLIPILEYLDRRGITVRSGDRRAVPAG